MKIFLFLVKLDLKVSVMPSFRHARVIFCHPVGGILPLPLAVLELFPE